MEESKMGVLYNKHLSGMEEWLGEQENIDVRYINYNDFIKNPNEQIKTLNQFFNNKLKIEKAVKVVDKSLYRNR